MGGWFADNEPWPVEIEHAGEKATVFVKELDAYGQAMLDDLLAANDAGEAALKMGTRDLLKAELCITQWAGFTDKTGQPVPCTPATIRALHPAVLEKIVEKIDQGRPGPTDAATPPPAEND